jgi:hypothetical protein
MVPQAGEDPPDLALGDAHYDSFVVRILSRDGTGDLAFGRITHVGSQRTLAFRTTAELLAFMFGQLGDGAVDPPRNPTVPFGRP